MRCSSGRTPFDLSRDPAAARTPFAKEIPMIDDAEAAPAETQIRQALKGRVDALRSKDVARLLSHYAPDVRVFSLAPPLQRLGADTLGEAMKGWFASFDGPLGYELRDLDVTVGDDVAFVHGLGHISGRRVDGQDTDVWTRVTVCLRRIHGQWIVAHEHSSVPFYMDGSLRAAVDLHP
jgi:ketosteroid isomerase-like protein